MRQLEVENRKFKQIVADLSLDKAGEEGVELLLAVTIEAALY
jgi:hypothetical protein